LATKAVFNCIHNSAVTRHPPDWGDYWQLLLSPESGAVYDELSQDVYAQTEVDLDEFVRYLGISKNKFKIAMVELEEYGLALLEVLPGETAEVIILPVPVVPDDAPEPPVKKQPKTPWAIVFQFLNEWSTQCELNTKDLYPTPKPGTRDTILTDEMLRTYSLDSLKRVAAYWFLHRHDDEPVTINYFHHNLARFVSEFKANGGSVLPKRREKGHDSGKQP